MLVVRMQKNACQYCQYCQFEGYKGRKIKKLTKLTKLTKQIFIQAAWHAGQWTLLIDAMMRQKCTMQILQKNGVRQ